MEKKITLHIVMSDVRWNQRIHSLRAYIGLVKSTRTHKYHESCWSRGYQIQYLGIPRQVVFSIDIGIVACFLNFDLSIGFFLKLRLSKIKKPNFHNSVSISGWAIIPRMVKKVPDHLNIIKNATAAFTSCSFWRLCYTA